MISTFKAAVPSLAPTVTAAPCDLDSALERVRFFPGQALGALDLNLEHDYFKQRLRRHNRFLHGWGVVCGCAVLPAPDQQRPLQVRICPGYLLTPQGDEVLINSQALFDLEGCFLQSADPCAYARPCPPVAQPAVGQVTVHLAVRYIECEARPVRVAPIGCSCDDAQCEYSRIKDAYELCCLDQVPDSHGPLPWTCDDLCQGGIRACPPCTDNPWVVLASITLTTGSLPTPIAANQISLAHRRNLYSAAMLQEMALCNCTQLPQPQLPAPTITPDQGTFDETTPITLTDANTSAQVFYTVDGTPPAPGQGTTAQYSGPFTLKDISAQNSPITVRAVASLKGFRDSPEASLSIEWQEIF